MSDGFVYTEYGRYFEQEEEKRKAADKKFKILKILVLILSVVLILNVVLYAVVFPCFSPAHVVITGLENISENDVLKKSGMDLSVTWASFDKKEFASRLASNPMLDAESIKIEKKFPDQILVHVNERVPVALSMINVDGRTKTVQIDKNGVVFTGARANIGQIPLITGLELEKVSEGFHIAPRYKALLDRVSAINEIEPLCLAAVSEIHARSLASGNYELVLYPINSSLHILADRSFSDDCLRKLLVVIDIMDTFDPDVYEIDMRYGTISYKKRVAKVENVEGIHE